MPLNHLWTCRSSLCRIQQFNRSQSSKLADFVLRQELTQIINLDSKGLSKLQDLRPGSLLPIDTERAFVAFAFYRPGDNRVLAELWPFCKFDLDGGFSATVLDKFTWIFRTS